MNIHIKRIYAPPSQEDGYRVLVDRLWPRGVSKEKAKADLWLKEIAPTNDLRHWFNHEEEKWPEFQKRYRDELRANPEAVREFKDKTRGHGTVTLLYGAKDEQHNQAIVLKDFLRERNA